MEQVLLPHGQVIPLPLGPPEKVMDYAVLHLLQLAAVRAMSQYRGPTPQSDMLQIAGEAYLAKWGG